MSANVWLGAAALSYPLGGGHLWSYLNWALGFRALGCRVTWVEAVDPSLPAAEIRPLVRALAERLEPYGFGDAIALSSSTGELLEAGIADGCIDVATAADADLFLNITYESCPDVRKRARCSALLDIDPGLTQAWIEEGVMHVPRHDVYFTIGEGVGSAGQGIRWTHTPPCVALDHWPVHAAPDGAPFTTVSHWDDYEWVSYRGKSFSNNKRASFLKFVELPSRTSQPLELAICQEADEALRLVPVEEKEKLMLERFGWRVVHSFAVASTAVDYQRYIQRSRGEFSCAKPSYSELPAAWLSDRTLCYLASGKPAIVQYTGPSSFLPDAAGMFRFRTLEEAAAGLDAVAADYPNQCRLARSLAEEHFDARKVTRTVLEHALD